MAQLTAPTITATLINGIDIRISGIQTANASGYKVRWGTLSGYGREDAITPTDGSYTLDDTFARTTYYVAVKAVGDGETYTDSDWSNEVTVVTEGTEDSSLTAPSLTLGTGYSDLGQVWVHATVGESKSSYPVRYQIATSQADLANQPPKIAGGYTVTSMTNSSFTISDLAPGDGYTSNKTYYVRICEVRGKQCSAWSDAKSVTTRPQGSSHTVTASTDTGTGSICEALQAAQTSNNRHTIVFDQSLDGQTIYMTSNWSYTASTLHVFIDASNLPHGIIIDGGNLSEATISVSFASWKNVTFKNLKTTSANYAFYRGNCIDCRFIDCLTSVANESIFSQSSFYRCSFTSCSTAATSHLFNDCCAVDSVISGNTDTTKPFGVAKGANLVNCYIGGNTNITYINNGGAINGCVIQNNILSGNKCIEYNGIVREAIVIGNTTTTADTNVSYASMVIWDNLYYCRFIGNTLTSTARRIVSGKSGAVAVGCIFKNNTGTSLTCLYDYALTRCEVWGSSATASQVIYKSSSTPGDLIDTFVYGAVQSDQAITNCTITKIVDFNTTNFPTIHNTLAGPSTTSTISGTDNIKWDETDSTSPNYVGKIFRDYANGDYRLKHGSPAINAGDDQYVTSGDLDLAGNARINGTAVDIGCYEFYSSQLDPPTFTVTPGAGGTGSVAFELPEGGVSFRLESDTTDQFSNPREYTASSSPLTISGYTTGTAYFRAKTLGATADEDSDWSAVTSVFFDATPPTVTAIINLATNDTICRLQPTNYIPNSITIDYLFTISDDTDPSPSYHWYIYDPDNTLIDDGTGNLPNQMLPEGKSCRVEVVVTDATGNSASASCTLAATFAKPTFTYTTGPGGTLTIAYTLPQGADGTDVRYRASGGSWTMLTGVDNPCVITGLDGTYEFQLRATKSTDVWVYSGWTTTQTATLDAFAPVLTVPETAVDMTAGASVDLMTGVSAVDNQDPAPTIHYTIQDAQGQTVVIGGQTQDLATDLLSPGTYTITYSASDATGNVSTAERALKVRLAAPTYTITTGANGTATISYTLPEGAVGCDILPLYSESFNPPVWIFNAPNPCIVTGLNGPYIFYLHATSPGGAYDSKNVKSGVYWLDAITPTVTVADKTRLEYVVGDTTVNLLDGVSATDDHDASVPLVYYLQNANNEIVEVDGARNNIPSEDVPIGGYKIVYEATDTAGNKGYNDRPLLVLPTVLETPTIACVGLCNTTATIGGLNVEHAYGYDIEVDGEVRETIDPPTSGMYAIANLEDNAAHTIRAKALGDWEEPIGHYRDSGWSNSVTVIIGNPAEDNAPVITREQVTDRSITIGVSEYESTAGYFQILIGEDKDFANPIVITKVPADEITITGLKASTIYYLKLKAVFAESTTPWSNVLLFQTEDLGPITPQDKLLYIRERIGMLRAYLADYSNLDSVSIDGISETKIDREKLLKELADLEAEEARLARGGGRLTTMDIRWTIR